MNDLLHSPYQLAEANNISRHFDEKISVKNISYRRPWKAIEM
jgi:hypothetical protein